MKTFWQAALAELEAGKKVFAAFVADSQKGSPGTPKARLLLCEDGRQVGTIGGGIMEAKLLQAGKQLLREPNPTPQLQTLHHKRRRTDSSGLICGGSQTNALIVLTSKHIPVLQAACQSLRTDDCACLELSSEGLAFLPLRKPMSRISELLTGPENCWQLRLSLRNHRRVAIFGSGHCGQALARQMLRLEFQVTLCDERPDLHFPDCLSAAADLTGLPFKVACSRIADWDQTAVVVMTSGLPGDVTALRAALPYRAPFIGVMGSPPKLKRIFDELKECGFAEADLERITAPVGLPIGSDTPEEIAVSIAAQLLQLQNTLFSHAPEHSHYLSA